ncbi:MAG: S8 family serine peptidase [Hyphomicrobiales bacterium]|nr:S8 family serine peptidase [Hyphomicrobiales bacterium]
MSPIKTLTRLIRRSETNGSRAVSGTNCAALPADELGFVLEYPRNPDLEAARRQLAMILDTLDFVLEPLFPMSADDLAHFAILRFPGVSAGRASDALFAIAYELGEKIDLVSCEPCIGEHIMTVPEPAQEASRVGKEYCGAGALSGSKHFDKRWALANTGVFAAWQLSPDLGKGIIIAQPDTGVAKHHEIESDSLRLDLAADIIGGDDDPTDPLDPHTANPGHGSGTASVVVGRRTGEISGAAPGAQLVPICCIQDVTVVNPTQVARAVNHARISGCHIVSMSLGGLGSVALHNSIQKAVEANLIVIAAAGNCIGLTVYPARYPEVIAVAGTNINDGKWQGTSVGRAVDISAPAEMVWRAKHDMSTGGKPIVAEGEGTAYSAALTAGIAALWLGRHGRDNLIAEANSRHTTLQELFRAAVRHTTRVPAGWNSSRQGSGIIDAEALLRLKPRDIPTVSEGVCPPNSGLSEVQRLVFEATQKKPESRNFDWPRYEAEIANLALRLAHIRARGNAQFASRSRRRFAVSECLRKAIEASGDAALRDLTSNFEAGLSE